MRRRVSKRAAAALATVVLAALFAAVTDPPPPAEATPHSTPSGNHCNPPINPGLGSYTCSYVSSTHYITTGTYTEEADGPGPGVTCDGFGRCVRTVTVTCEPQSLNVGCGVPALYSTSGPYEHWSTRTDVYGCPSSSHRSGGGCHVHVTPTAQNYGQICGVISAHAVTRSVNPVPGGTGGGGSHADWDTGVPCGNNPIIVNPPPPPPPQDPTLTVTGETVGEGDGAAEFTISLSPAASAPVTFDVATSDGTATEGDDYAPVSRQVTIPTGSTSAVVSTTVLDDTDDESDETFMMTLSNPSSNAELASTPSAEATITDDDTSTAPTNIRFTCSGTSPRYNLAYSWDPPSTGTVHSYTVTMRWAYAIGYPTTVAPHQRSWSTTQANSGTYWLTLRTHLVSGGGSVAGDQVSVATICSDLPQLSVADAPDATEGSGLVFTVSSNRTPSAAVTVDVATVAGTATAGSDYTVVNRTVTIPANTRSVDVSVSTVDDTVDELDETLELQLSSPSSGAILSVNTIATGRILDDDEPTVSITAPAGSVDEDTSGTANDLDFTVRLDAPAVRTVTVTATTSSGTATGGTCGTAGVDFAQRSATVTFIPGDVEETFTVRTCPDAVAGEGTEDFTVTLSGAFNASMGTSSATGQIDDTDDVTVSISGPAGPADEDTGGASNTVAFTVSLDVASTQQVTVMAATTAGTASDAACASGGDFLRRSMTVRFGPGDTTKSFNVRTCADAVPEVDESFTVTLSSPSNAVLGTATASATIRDNDEPQVSVSGPAAAVSEDTSGLSNDVVFTVALDVAHVKTVTVTAATSSGTATGGTCGSAGVDYANRTATVTFSPGDTSELFTVSTCPDTTTESDEQFTVSISGPSNATLGSPTTASAEIQDNDSTPQQQCQALHGPGWTPVLKPDGTVWYDSGGQIICAQPH